MDREGQTHQKLSRSGSRRNQRHLSETAPEGGSSTDEETDPKRSFNIPLKPGERTIPGRSRITPIDPTPDTNFDYEIASDSYNETTSSSEKKQDFSDKNKKQRTLDRSRNAYEKPDIIYQRPSDTTKNHKGSRPHYYQDVLPSHYTNTLDDYDSPIGKKPHRLRKPNGSSLSSSDNNSDTTYAESDINSSLRARMAALERENTGTPPDPVPPDVPPRGMSYQHPLLSSQRRHGTNPSHSPQDPTIDAYHTQNVFLSQEYLMDGNNPQYGDKSPGSLYGLSPNRGYTQSELITQSRIMGTMDQKPSLDPSGMTGGVGLTSLPIVMNSLSLSTRTRGRSVHLGKSWRDWCSWKFTTIALIFIIVILLACLTYFIVAYATMQSRSKKCVLIQEDAAKVIAASTESEIVTHYSTPSHTESITTKVPHMQKNPYHSIESSKSLNNRYSSKIPPQGYWHSQYEIKQPMFLRFNLTIPRSSQLAIYGRRNAAPSITQYEFVEFVRGGRLSRIKRESLLLDKMAEPENSIVEYEEPVWLEDFVNPENEDEFIITQMTSDAGRSKRYLTEREVNISIVQQVDTGTLYVSIYNDGLAYSLVTLMAEELPEMDAVCPLTCSGHGSCVLGKCKCFQGWFGDECSKSMCPILCSGHGNYAGGICHCKSGWKGRECDIPLSDCEVPGCSGNGVCISGMCRCNTGWQGEHCNIVDCKDSTCDGHGWCVGGTCVCRAGWTGSNCSQVDHKVFTCLPDCSGNGHYDLHTSKCICNPYWSGHDCSEARCNLDCVHGTCDGNVCTCNEDWTGVRCNELACDSRCSAHGQCHNGTCLCVQGWNGKHCTIPGCVNSCSGHGLCTTDEGQYHCSCSPGWTGKDCSVALETQCSDDKDNDGDGLVDCNDSECCSTEECRDHVMCMVSSDPVEVLLRKQPPSVTASFYQRVKFIIEDKNVQSFARKSEFSERRVSVIRGQVVTPYGQGIVGVRTSIDKESKYGLTATRKGGWFDLLLNGGGAVTLQFQRAHFEPKTVTVTLNWNEIVVLDPVIMTLKSQSFSDNSLPPELRWSNPCIDHDYDAMKPQVISTYIPNVIGSVPDSSVIFSEGQVVQETLQIPGSNLHLIYHSSSVPGYMSTLLIQLTPAIIPKTLSIVHLKVTLEGIVFDKVFEADPNITYSFRWNKRNVYKQKVYGETIAKVSIGFEYSTCSHILWEIQTAKLHGFTMDISHVGGWNLNIHHMYNFERGLLQRGDGSTLNLKDSPRLVRHKMGTGSQRPLNCRSYCSGIAKDADLLMPVALASGSDGSVYVGDFNLIRKISPDGYVSTILQLESTQVSYSYHLAVSPVDGKIYLSDPEKYRIVRLLTSSNVSDLINNIELIAGTGERCIPGDEKHCGDKGPARKARLAHPKGIAISYDRIMYIADGTNIRMIDANGIIFTLIGHHGHKSKWKPLPCSGGIPANQIELQWPTGLALSTLDNSLHILDDHVVLQVTLDGIVRVKAGTPLHCSASKNRPSVGTITGLAFAPSGTLYLAEQSSNKHNVVLELSPSGQLRHFAGATPEQCECLLREKCICPQQRVTLSNNVLMGSVSAITVSFDGVVHIADQHKLKILSFSHFLPIDDTNGDYQVSYPSSNELYVFNRHGHHVETKNLVSGRTVYAFLYSKNTSFGRLSKVTDVAGNKILFLRDYNSVISQVENTFGEKFKVEINRLGLITKLTERSDRYHDFMYDDESGLLLSSTTIDRLTTVYEYSTCGKVKTVVLPIGERIHFDSYLNGEEKKHLEISVTISKFNNESPKKKFVIALIKEKLMEFSHDEVHGSITSWSNGTWQQNYPWGGSIMANQVVSNPLLEVIEPTQARLFPVPQQLQVSAGGSLLTNALVTSYGVVENHLLQERLVEKLILVNGSRIFNRQWKGAEQTEYLLDGDSLPILHTSYNNNGQAVSLTLSNALTSVNSSYDRYGRISSRYWGKDGEEYDYNKFGLLTTLTTTSSAATSYRFDDNRLVKSITLPSGRSWIYQYDKRGGLKQISNPLGGTHSFSLQPSFGAYIFSYTPPGSSKPYRQHFDPSGKLILTSYPSDSSKVLYMYSDFGQLNEIVSGDGKTKFTYSKDSLISQILHNENDLDYKWDYLYNGKLTSELIIDFEARTGLSNIKYEYEYDEKYRLIKIRGRVGGQNLHSYEFSYNEINGSPKKIGPFKVYQNTHNETLFQDGTAIFGRIQDNHFRIKQLSVNIHKMEVFSLGISYQRDGKISQTNTYTRNFHSKPFSNTKNYTYDADGQLISVEAKKPWHFSYDGNGNMLSLTFSTNKIPMQYDTQDRLIKLGKQGYQYDNRGAIVQNVREVNYQYNARGLLIHASKSGRFSIKYFYDHQNRLIARKDNFGNVTQFLYSDHRFPNQVTHIYNPRDGNLVTLLYDDVGHVIFSQVYKHKYYIATDECGSPIMMFNQYGEVVREIMRSPYGHNVYDTNPYLYIPIDYCGGIRETITELVHMPNGRVYDPLIGIWLYPNWENIAQNFMEPSSLSLYRFNGNDPINVGSFQWKNAEYFNWIEKVGYRVQNLVPQMPNTDPSRSQSSLWNVFTKDPSHEYSSTSPVSNQIKGIHCISGYAEYLKEGLDFITELPTNPPSLLKKDFWPSGHKFDLSITAGPFGEGVLVSTVDGKAIVTTTHQANPIFKDVLTSVFNSTILLDIIITAHNSYVYYFVKEDFFKATEDMTQLNRLAGEVNISVHEPSSAPSYSDDNNDKVVDIKLHSASAVVHIRYGTTGSFERKRLLKHAKKITSRRAWMEERERLLVGLPGSVPWSPSEKEELLNRLVVSSYSTRYLHEDYPSLLDDPNNIKFYKDTKRTRRNLKQKKSRRCRRKWWKPFC